jgi:hypothetical protein
MQFILCAGWNPLFQVFPWFFHHSLSYRLMISYYFRLPVFSHSLYISLWLYSLCGHWPLFQSLTLFTIGRTPWTGDQPIARPLPTHRTTQPQNKRTQTSMPQVGFEPMIPVFERAKTVHALDRAATMIGIISVYILHICLYIVYSCA